MATGDYSKADNASIAIGGCDADEANDMFGVVLDSISAKTFTLRMFSVDVDGNQTSLGDESYTITGTPKLIDTPNGLFHVRDNLWLVVCVTYVNTPSAYRYLYLVTVEADEDGFVSGILDEQTFATTTGVGTGFKEPRTLNHISGDIYGLAYWSDTSDCVRYCTLEIAGNGGITQLDDEYLFESSGQINPVSRVLVDNLCVIGGYHGLATVSVDTGDGTISVLDGVSFGQSVIGLIVCQLDTSGDNYIVACTGTVGSTMYLRTYEVSIDGTTINSTYLYSSTIGSNRNNATLYWVDNDGYYDWLLWGAQDASDWDLDVGTKKVAASGDIVNGATNDGIQTAASGGGPSLVNTCRAKMKPNNADFDVVAVPFAQGIVTLEVETEDIPGVFGVLIEAAFDQSIWATSPIWTDVTSDLLAIEAISRGRKHGLDRIEAGTMRLELDNSHGNWWRNNVSGDYYPDVKPLTLIRVRAQYEYGITYDIFYGVVESFEPDWKERGGGFVPTMRVGCVDLFKTLSRYKLLSLGATVGSFENVAEITSNASSGQPDVEVDTDWLGYLRVGQQITIKDTINSEVGVISAINEDGTVTLTENLTNSYTIANDACIKKFPQCLAGARVSDCLLELGVPTALYTVDAGTVEVIELETSSSGDNIMEHLFKVVEAELGRLFVANDGIITFLDATAPVTDYDTSQATFSDTGDSEYHDLGLSDDDEYLYNESSISGGSDASPFTESVKDSAKQSTQGARSLDSSGSLLAESSDAFNQAMVNVLRYSYTRFRCQNLTVKPESNPDDLYSKVLGYDLLTKLRLKLNEATLDEFYHIEGIKHSWSPLTGWVTSWQLWEPNRYQIYDLSAVGSLHNPSVPVYQDAHDAANGLNVTSNYAHVVQRYSGGYYYIHRAIWEFDTSLLPSGKTVEAAWIILEPGPYNNPVTAACEMCLVECQPGVDVPLALADFGTQVASTTVYGSVEIAAGYLNLYPTIMELNSSGIAVLVAEGTTRFGLRMRNDIDAVAPTTTDEGITAYSTLRDFTPRLLVRIA